MERYSKRNGEARITSSSVRNGRREHRRPVLITGGSGFIGANVADRLLTLGYPVVILDNLSREGVDQNAIWLQQKYGRAVKVIVGDVRDKSDVRRALSGVEHVFHFAAQVAVTTSLADPRTDFDINVSGTLNLLEEIRSLEDPPSLIYTSTNKVYGELDDISLECSNFRYVPVDPNLSARGISEARPLSFHTPYGCSKGAAEQYVLDYARCYGLRNIVFRMSCIYGPHQFGTEDQGWVAHFLIRALEGRPITIYGDGRQVRDILFVDDLVNAFLLAWRGIGKLRGNAFNIGGGVERTVSLLELIELIGRMTASKPKLYFEQCRSGDQRYYVTDLSNFRNATGWSPSVSPQQGLHRLYDWLLEARRLSAEEMAAS
jgi:CDP-paratose 2-epimerase